MRIVLNISKEKLVQIVESGQDLIVDLDLVVGLPLTPEKKIRKKRSGVKDAFIQLPDEQTVLDLWNNSHFIGQVCKGLVSDSRNKMVSEQDLPQVVPVLKRALRTLTVDEIRSHMDSYFAACAKGKHIWDDTNHGYKHVGGFLSRLISCKRTGQMPWWEMEKPKLVEEDDFPDITAYLADRYAEKYLFAQSFELEANTKEHMKFIRAAKYIGKVIQAEILPFADPLPEFISLIFRCVDRHNTTQTTIYPGHLCSETLWKVQLPQFLYDQLGLDETAVERYSSVVFRV